jgi:fatty acid-binding protein DegV
VSIPGRDGHNGNSFFIEELAWSRSLYALTPSRVKAAKALSRRTGVSNGDSRGEAERVKELVEAKVNVVESFFGELSPALAVHTGPGMAGLCYYPVDD